MDPSPQHRDMSPLSQGSFMHSDGPTPRASPAGPYLSSHAHSGPSQGQGQGRNSGGYMNGGASGSRTPAEYTSQQQQQQAQQQRGSMSRDLPRQPPLSASHATEFGRGGQRGAAVQSSSHLPLPSPSSSNDRNNLPSALAALSLSPSSSALVLSDPYLQQILSAPHTGPVHGSNSDGSGDPILPHVVNRIALLAKSQCGSRFLQQRISAGDAVYLRYSSCCCACRVRALCMQADCDLLLVSVQLMI